MDYNKIEICNIKVMILAAGFGTRMSSLTQDVPKIMLPVEDSKPLLEHTICLLRNQGFRKFIVNLHYLPEKIINYFKDGKGFGVEIIYSDESQQLLETAGAIKKAENFLSDDFILIYGDQLHFFDFRPALEFHRRNKALATIILKRSDLPQNGDLVEIDHKTKKINKWHPRPHKFHDFSNDLFLNSGLYVLSKEILNYIPPGSPSKLDIEIFPNLVKQGKAVYGFFAEQDILDIGTPEKYEIAKQWYKKNKPLFYKNKAVFLDRDGIINKALPRGEYLTELEQFELQDGIAGLIRHFKGLGYLIITITNQAQIAKGMLPLEKLKKIHDHMLEQLTAANAKIDKIYYCPHQNSDNCECRKPNIGLLLKAIDEFSIDPSSSFFIGDSDKDINAGFTIGCKTIFLRNEHNKEELPKCQPDFVVKGLDEILLIISK